MTDHGPLDLLGRIGQGRTYTDLARCSEPMEIEPGLSVLVLNLETQIAVKEEVAGEKDRWILALLRRTLAERPPK